MKVLLAAALATITAAGVARAQDGGETVLSTQDYDGDVAVTAETLTCVFSAANPNSYVPVDTAWSNLTLGDDEIPVLKHPAAGLSVEAQRATARRRPQIGDPRALCPKITATIADAAAHAGKLSARKHLVLALVEYPNGYGHSCQRYLRENLTVTFANGLALNSEQYKTLATRQGSCAGK